MRIALIQFSHETNPLVPHLTEYEDFIGYSFRRGQDFLSYLRGTRGYLAGAIAVADQEDVELVPILGAKCVPSGLIRHSASERIFSEIFEGLAASGPIDAIFVELHGAACSEAEADLEGVLLRRLRERLPNKPIAATLDLHANVSDAMVRNCDALIAVKEYPHSDMFDCGTRAMAILLALLKQETRTKVVHFKLPFLAPLTRTDGGIGAVIKGSLSAALQSSGALDISLTHGFPYAEHDATGVSVIATLGMDAGERPIGEEAVRAFAGQVWMQRAYFVQTLVDPVQAFDMVEENFAKTLTGPIVLSEGSDNPGGGGYADGTHLLAEMLQRDLPGSVFCFICDPEVVAAAHKAGASAALRVELGGKTHSYQGVPLAFEGIVRSVHRGEITSTGPLYKGETIRLGRSCVLQRSNVQIIVAERRYQPLNEDMLVAHGLAAARSRVVALKSAVHFRAWWSEVAAQIIDVSTPGLSPLDLHLAGFSGANLGKYPFNRGAECAL